MLFRFGKLGLISIVQNIAAVCALAVTAAADDQTPIQLPGGTEIVDVDFERHVAGLFSRLGCNGASCHGSFQGKGGFYLSLFGQSPAKDYTQVYGDGTTGRIDLKSPDDSLLLTKPSLRESHEGGLRLPRDSWEYRLIQRWIVGGARRTTDSGTIAKLTIDPPTIPPLMIGQKFAMRVIAEFANGDRQDVTPFAEFRSRDDLIVDVDVTGQVTAKTAGDTSLIIAYRGTFVGIPAIVPFASTETQPQVRIAQNWIDDEVNARLERLNLVTSPLTDDAEFLRRVTLDVIGLLPTQDEILSFLDDNNPNKRSARIDELLTHSRRASCWATKMCDITGCTIEQLGPPDDLRPKRAKMWHDWFRKRFAENMSYDQIVHGVLCATSRMNQPIDSWIDTEIELEKRAQAGFETNYQDRSSLDYFWRRIGPQGPLPVEDLAELAATAFLGLRLHCARCHQHPYDHWTQDDFAGFANIFARTEFGSSTELRTAVNDRLERRRKARQAGEKLSEFPRVQEVFLHANPRPLIDAMTPKPVPAKAPNGPVLSGDADSRETLFRWLTRPDNPYFAQSFVNRIWAKYFGFGLVDPVDSFSMANPPVNPRLLERLAAEFAQSGYDIQHIERLILSSAAYQRTARATGNNASDRRNVAHAVVRPLPAEVLIDSLNASLETSDNFGSDVPSGSQAVELAPNRFNDPAVNELFRILGRGNRKTFCDCSRASGPSIRQPLYLMSDAKVIEKIRDGRLARLLEQKASDAQIVNEFYLATLSRRPDPDERDFALQHIAETQNRIDGLTDIVWALINSREFSTNH